jgi:hypothetical protein
MTKHLSIASLLTIVVGAHLPLDHSGIHPSLMATLAYL